MKCHDRVATARLDMLCRSNYFGGRAISTLYNPSDHRRAPCSNVRISTRSAWMRCSRMNGELGKTNSRVPGSRPARPISGKSPSLSALSQILRTVCVAAIGLSCSIYRCACSRRRRARGSHTTFIATACQRRPVLPHRLQSLLHLLRARQS